MSTSDQDKSTALDTAPTPKAEDEFDYGEEFFTATSKNDGQDLSVPAEVNENNSETEQNTTGRQNVENSVIVTLQREENSQQEEQQEQEPSELDNDDGGDNKIDDWDDLEVDPQQGTDLGANSTEVINFSDALQHFNTVDLNEYHSQIKPNVKHSGISAFLHSIIGPSKLHKSLVSERNLIFTLALVPFSNEDKIHNRILQSVYKTLTRRKIDCARFGPHWELIGFQGNDPSTDLRGCGMLGLLTTLHFVGALDSKSLAANVYHLSRDEIQNFPFCVMSINVTRICLQILRHGKLNKECNHRMKHKSQKYKNQSDTIVFDIFQELYNAIFYKIYTVWKNEGKTMTESGYVIRDIETLAKHNPLDLIREYKSRNSKKQSGHSPKKKSKGAEASSNEGKIESFVGVEDL